MHRKRNDGNVLILAATVLCLLGLGCGAGAEEGAPNRPGSAQPSAGQSGPESDNLAIELVDPKVLRVCADPNGLPFSNEKGEGFENKLGELFAGKLGKG